MTKNNDDVRAAHLISNIELGTGGKVEKAKPEIQAVENPDCTSLNVPEYALKTGLKVVPDYDDSSICRTFGLWRFKRFSKEVQASEIS